MFISFEGIEGSGKSTQARRLAAVLEERGIPVLCTREPGGTPLGARLRKLLTVEGKEGPIPLAELFLVEADRAQHVAEVLRPALDAGTWVVSDRFADSTLAYQGYGRGLDPALIREMDRCATGGLRPDMTFLLDCPVEIALERVRKRTETHPRYARAQRFENEPRAFHQRVREGYLSLVAADSTGRFRVLDARLSPEELHRKVWEEVWKRSRK